MMNTTNTKIEVDQELAITSLINQFRSMHGWKLYDRTEIAPIVATWKRILDFARIPVRFYQPLFLRATELRSSQIQKGERPSDFSAELLVSQWTGSHGLKAELERKQIAEKRSLPIASRASCPKCLGTGLVHKFNAWGKIVGVMTGTAGKCDHVPVNAPIDDDLDDLF